MVASRPLCPPGIRRGLTFVKKASGSVAGPELRPPVARCCGFIRQALFRDREIAPGEPSKPRRPFGEVSQVPEGLRMLTRPGAFRISQARRYNVMNVVASSPCGADQLRQLGDIDRYPAGLVGGEQLGSGAATGLILAIDECQRLLVGVVDNEARSGFFDRPWRRKTTALGHARTTLCARLPSGGAVSLKS